MTQQKLDGARCLCPAPQAARTDHMADLEAELNVLGIEGAHTAIGALSSRAEDYSNDAGLEQVWALKAIKYAETHFKLIQSVDASKLRLTRYDDEIFQNFQKRFRNMQVDKINPDDLKSAEAKEIWRPFCKEYEGTVQDYNFGTLLRLDCSLDYSEQNTILVMESRRSFSHSVPRIQFLTVEIARNRLGLNSVHFSVQS